MFSYMSPETRLRKDHPLREANGTAERNAALIMLERIPGTEPVTRRRGQGI